MAGPTVKEILLKFGIDNSNWKKAIQDLANLLDQTNKNAAKQAATAQKNLDAQKAKIQQIHDAQKAAAAVIDKQVAQQELLISKQKAQKAIADARLASEKANAAQVKNQVLAQQALQAVQRTAQTQIATQLAQQRLITAQINAQTAGLRQQAAAQRAAQPRRGGGGGGGGREGGGGGFLGRIAGGLFGGGPFGMIAGAVASAEGFEHALEMALEKLKEFSKEVGPLQQVREQFEKLAASRGISAPAKFIEELRGATHGLVNDMQLYRNANTFMQSSIHASNEDIISLTKATVGLARAQGRDATEAVQHLQRFFLTGRAMTLAYATGIQMANLRVGQLGHGTDTTIRTQIQFKQALEAVTEQYKMIGEPAETYTEKLEKVGVAAYRVLEEFMLGLENSAGFKAFLEQLDEIATQLGMFSEKAAGFGEKFGDIFAGAGIALEGLAGAFTLIRPLLEGVVNLVDELAREFTALSVSSDDTAGSFDKINNAAHPWLSFFTKLTAGIEIVIAGFTEMSDVILTVLASIGSGVIKFFHDMSSWKTIGELWKPNKGVQEEWDKFFEREKKRAKDLEDSVGSLYDKLNDVGRLKPGDYKIKFSAPTELFTDQQRIDAEKKYAKIKEQLVIETSKTELEYTKLRIADEQEIIKQQYEKGLIAHADYIDKKKALDKQEIQARIKDENAEYAARAEALQAEVHQQKELAYQKQIDAALDKQLRLADLDSKRVEAQARINSAKDLSPGQKAVKTVELGDQYKGLQQLVNNSYSAAIRVSSAEIAEIQAKEKVEAQKHQLDLAKIANEGAGKERASNEELIKDILDARKKLTDELEKMEKSRIDRERAVTEKQFADQAISAQEYLQKKESYIEQDYDAVVKGAKAQLDVEKNSVTGQAAYAQKLVEAAETREKALTALMDSEWDIRTKAAKEAVDRITSVLEAQLSIEQEVAKSSPFSNRTNQVQIINSLVAAEKAHLEILKQQTAQLASQPKLQAENQAEIAKTQQKLIKYEEELIKTRDYSKDLADEARNMATAASLFPKGGKTAAGLEKYAQITETLGKLNQDFLNSVNANRGGRQVPKTPEEIYAALKSESDKAAGGLRELTDSASAATQAAVDTVHEKLAVLFPAQVDVAIRALSEFADALGKATPKEGEGTFFDKMTSRSGVNSLDVLGGRAGGGSILETGPYTMHAGEYVLPTSMASVFNSFIKALGDFTKFLEPKLAAIKPGVSSTPVRAVEPVSHPEPPTNVFKEFLLSLENFGRALLGKKPIQPKSITGTSGVKPLGKTPTKPKIGQPGVAQPGKTTLKSLAPVKPKQDTTALEQNLKTLTDAINKLTDQITGSSSKSTTPPASSPATSAQQPSLGQLLKPATSAGSVGVSGLPTPTSPQGVMTDSDKQDLDANLNANTTSGLGNSQGTSDSLMALAQSAQAAAQALTGVADSGAAKTSQDAAGGGDGQGADDGGGGGGSAASQLGTLSKGITSMMGMVGGVMQTFKTTGAFQGAMAGAASFGQIGSMVGGPIGGAVGAVVGGIAGAISGAMRAATERMAERLVAAFNAVIQEVQSGNQTLGAGIALSIQQIQTTVTSLSGKKGGRDDLKQILPNMEQQLAQLQAQQKAVLQSMDQQVTALNAPLAYQGQLGSIQTIITAYQQYIQAGGNVVTANQYLQDSFQNLVTQGMQQLNQDEQDAVNNALNYNNLLLQRQTLIQNTNSEIQQIMSQGVAVRQVPEGVSKAIQIQQLMLNSSQQMDQLNQQISVSQYQLTVQQKIFGLATTRIGLENQLVILQNEQTNYSMQQIEALGNVVGAFSTKLPTSMQGAEQELGFGGAFVNPSTEPGLKPVPPVKTGIAQIDLQNQLQYQQALAAWQLSQNFPIGYIPTSGNVGTTPVPTTIGNPSVYSGSGGPANETWLTPGSTSILGTATGAATSFNTALSAANALPSSVMGSLGTSGLTVNGAQVDTIGTSSGTALLVAPETSTSPLQTVPIITGPGTMQGTGIVGTAAGVAGATNTLFNSLSGASTQLIKATAGPAPPVAPVSVPKSDLQSTSEQPAAVNVMGMQIPGGMTQTQFTQWYLKNNGDPFDLGGAFKAYSTASPAPTASNVNQNTSSTAAVQLATTATTAPASTQKANVVSTPAGLALLVSTVTEAMNGVAASATGTSVTKPPVSGAVGTTGLPALPAPVASMVGTMANLFSTMVGVRTGKTQLYSPPSTTPVYSSVTPTSPLQTPTAQVSSPVVSQVVAQQSVATNALVTTSLQRVNAETQISQLSNVRVASETALVNMKMTEIQADMQRVQMHNDLLTRVQTWGSTSTSLETMLQQVYDNRGRQGFGKFYGEISNPT
jgi:hypothetical protein